MRILGFGDEMGVSGLALGGVRFGVGVEELLLAAIFIARSLGMWVDGCLVPTMEGTVKA